MADGDLGWNDLGIAIDFSRPISAEHRGPAGTIVTAPPGAPRREHDVAGAPLGLLIGAGPTMGLGDRAIVDPLILAADQVGAEVTVLYHALVGGVSVRRAWYTRDAKATVDAMLRAEALLVSIGVVAGFLSNRDGHVRYRGLDWKLPVLIAAGAGAAIGDTAGRPLLGG